MPSPSNPLLPTLPVRPLGAEPEGSSNPSLLPPAPLPVDVKEWRALSFAALEALAEYARSCPEMAGEIQAGMLHRPILAARVILHRPENHLQIALREVSSGLFGIPGGKVGVVRGVGGSKCLEEPEMTAMRETAEEVLPSLLEDERRFELVMKELKLWTVLVTPVSTYPARRWRLHGEQDPASILRQEGNQLFIANASTLIFSCACSSPLPEEVHGRQVRWFNLEQWDPQQVRSQHRELLTHYREVCRSGSQPDPFVLHYSQSGQAG